MYMAETTTKKKKKLTRKQEMKNKTQFAYDVVYSIVYSLLIVLFSSMFMVSMKQYTKKLLCYHTFAFDPLYLPYSKGSKSFFVSVLELTGLKPIFDAYGWTNALNWLGMFEYKDDEDVFFFYRKSNTTFGALFKNWYSDIFIRSWSTLRYVYYFVFSFLSSFIVDSKEDQKPPVYSMKRDTSFFTYQTLVEICMLIFSPFIFTLMIVLGPLIGNITMFFSGFISNFVQMLFLWWTLTFIYPINSLSIIGYFSFMFLIYPLYSFFGEIKDQLEFILKKYLYIWLIMIAVKICLLGIDYQIDSTIYLAIAVPLFVFGILYSLFMYI